jgi:NDP-sugar pyrophosphorylase family protein
MASVLRGLPKALVPIGGTPLLALQLSRLRLNRCTQAVVVGGHGIRHLRSALEALSPSSDAVLLEETSGTLPAVLTGLGALGSEPGPVVVMNADTIVDVDLALCIAAAPAWAVVTAVLTELPTGQNEGSVILAATGQILAFEEADCSGLDGTPAPPGSSQLPARESSLKLSNCGLYVVNRERLMGDVRLRTLGSCWERHALVHYRRRGLLAGVAPPVHYVLDVGTPARFKRARADAALIHQICGYRQDVFESHSRLA